jgi:hypothetical protein
MKRYGKYESHIISPFNIIFFHIFPIFSLFNLLFFHIFHIFSLFNLPFLHIFHIFSLFNNMTDRATGSDVTPKGFLACMHAQPDIVGVPALFSGVFFSFKKKQKIKYGKMKCFYSVTQVTLNFKRCGLK